MAVIRSIDSNSDSMVTAAEISEHVRKDGIDAEQYRMQITERERCRAGWMLSKLLEYNKRPYVIEKNDTVWGATMHGACANTECIDIVRIAMP